MKKMIKSTGIALAMLMVLGLIQPALAVTIYYNNKELKSDVEPVIQEGRTMVPLAVIGQNLGATVEWKHDTKQIIITKGDTLMVLAINEKHVVVTQTGTANIQIIDSPPVIKNGRTLVPLGFISTYLGSKVEWDNENKFVLIDSDKEVIAEQIRQQLIAMERARNVQTIIASVKTDTYFGAMNLKADQFLFYEITGNDLVNNKVLASLQKSNPGTYEIYTYPVASPKRYETFYINTNTRKVYVEVEPLKFVYEYPGKNFVTAASLAPGTEADFVVEALKSSGYFDKTLEYVATVSNRGTGGISPNNVVVDVKVIKNMEMETVGDFYLNTDTLSIYDSNGRMRFRGPLQ